VLVCQDAHPIRAGAAETLQRHRRHAAGAGGRLMLGNSPFRNKKLSISEKKQKISCKLQILQKLNE
jgi:hypothetical protein